MGLLLWPLRKETQVRPSESALKQNRHTRDLFRNLPLSGEKIELGIKEL